MKTAFPPPARQTRCRLHLRTLMVAPFYLPEPLVVQRMALKAIRRVFELSSLTTQLEIHFRSLAISRSKTLTTKHQARPDKAQKQSRFFLTKCSHTRSQARHLHRSRPLIMATERRHSPTQRPMVAKTMRNVGSKSNSTTCHS